MECCLIHILRNWYTISQSHKDLCGQKEKMARPLKHKNLFNHFLKMLILKIVFRTSISFRTLKLQEFLQRIFENLLNLIASQGILPVLFPFKDALLSILLSITRYLAINNYYQKISTRTSASSWIKNGLWWCVFRLNIQKIRRTIQHNTSILTELSNTSSLWWCVFRLNIQKIGRAIWLQTVIRNN